ncbi:MAG: hypothetical protein QXW35_05640 [Candidatus Aenigmatarchaeota archaeon]
MIVKYVTSKYDIVNVLNNFDPDKITINLHDNTIIINSKVYIKVTSYTDLNEIIEYIYYFYLGHNFKLIDKYLSDIDKPILNKKIYVVSIPRDNIEYRYVACQYSYLYNNKVINKEFRKKFYIFDRSKHLLHIKKILL